MIVSKPKLATVVSLSIFLAVILGVFFYLLNSLLKYSDYFIIKLVLAPIILVIGLLVMGKLLGAMKKVSLGKDRMEVLFLISRQRLSIPVKDLLGWNEEVVDTRNGKFCETKICYAPKKILKLSNKENTEYDRVVKYLKQKVKVKRQA